MVNMRFAVLVVVAACGFTRGAPDDRGNGSATILDDTAADFSAGTMLDFSVDPLGLLVPVAVERAGMHARAYTTHAVTATTTWADLTDALLGPMAGERYGELPVTDWQYDRPHGVGLTAANDDAFTIVYDGQISLGAGATTVAVACDDFGFLEIEVDGVWTTAHCAWTDIAVATLAVSTTAAGWYPIRGAMSEGGGSAHFLVSTIDGTGMAHPITADAMRVDVTTAQGAMVIGAGDRILYAVQPTTSVEHDLIDADFASGPPTYDLPNVFNTGGNFALRYAAQLRVDTEGTYVFAVDPGTEAGDYERLLIDGTPVASRWPGMADMPASSTVLGLGWHDLVLDYADKTTADHVKLTMQPPGGVAAPIPAAQLRPVRAGYLLAGATGPAANVADATSSGPTTSTVPLAFASAPPAEAVVDFVDLFFYLAGTAPRSTVQVALVAPNGSASLTLPTAAVYETCCDYMPVVTSLATEPLVQAPGWSATFTDTLFDGSQETVTYPALVASYRGGPMAPFGHILHYTSAPHATPGALEIDAVTVSGDLAGATLMIEVRTGDATTLPTAAWVTVANGTSPTVAPDAYVQYRLTVTSNGWQYPQIDKVSIAYAVPPS
jgi:hypothetical protein